MNLYDDVKACQAICRPRRGITITWSALALIVLAYLNTRKD